MRDVGLTNRLVNNEDKFERIKDIDYLSVRETIKDERMRSIEWLEKKVCI